MIEETKIDRHTTDHLIKMMIVQTNTTMVDNGIREELTALLDLESIIQVQHDLEAIYNRCERDKSLVCEFILEAMETLLMRLEG